MGNEMHSTKCGIRRWDAHHFSLDVTVADQVARGEVSVNISQSKECKGIVKGLVSGLGFASNTHNSNSIQINERIISTAEPCYRSVA